MKTKIPTKDELRFIVSLQEGLKYARNLKAEGVIVERHPRQRATSDLDHLEALLLKKSSYRRVNEQTRTVSKVAARIIRYRQYHSLSQAALAKAAGLSRS